MRCGEADVLRIVWWATPPVFPGLALPCAEGPETISDGAAEGPVLPHVFPQHHKQDGGDKLRLSVCSKNTLRNRQGGAEAPHLSQRDGGPQHFYLASLVQLRGGPVLKF